VFDDFERHVAVLVFDQLQIVAVVFASFRRQRIEFALATKQCNEVKKGALQWQFASPMSVGIGYEKPGIFGSERSAIFGAK